MASDRTETSAPPETAKSEIETSEDRSDESNPTEPSQNLSDRGTEFSQNSNARSAESEESQQSDDALLRCLAAGFVDQLAVRRDRGTLECDLTEGRHGTLMRESVVQNASILVAALIREIESRGSEPLTLLGLATAVKTEWIEEMFGENVSIRVEHLFDRTHKRVAAVKLVRFRDLVIRHEHRSELDHDASGKCLADAVRKGWIELPLFNHEVKQFIARVNLVASAMPDLDFPFFDSETIGACLSRAFTGLSLAKEAQATHLRESFVDRLAPEQRGWLDELAPLTILWPDSRKLKLLYPEIADHDKREATSPELQIKLHECFALKEHPRICEGRVPIKLWLCSPDGKRIEPTLDWPAFKAGNYQKLKPVLQKKFPGVAWH